MKTEEQLHTNRHAKGTLGEGGKRTVVLGRQLEEGDVIEAGDLYDSTSGFWETSSCVGIKVAANNDFCTWVRPS